MMNEDESILIESWIASLVSSIAPSPLFPDKVRKKLYGIAANYGRLSVKRLAAHTSIRDLVQ